MTERKPVTFVQISPENFIVLKEIYFLLHSHRAELENLFPLNVSPNITFLDNSLNVLANIMTANLSVFPDIPLSDLLHSLRSINSIVLSFAHRTDQRSARLSFLFSKAHDMFVAVYNDIADDMPVSYIQNCFNCTSFRISPYDEPCCSCSVNSSFVDRFAGA